MNRLCVTLVALLSTALLASCGGGTMGTGGTSTRVLGSVVSTSGDPLTGAHVTLKETGVGAVVQSDGGFSLESVLPGEQFTLLIQSADVDAATEIMDVPADAEEVRVRLVVNKANNNVEVKEQSVIQRPTPTPRDRGRPRPTRSPTPEPTSSPDSSPTTAPVAPTTNPLPPPPSTPVATPTPKPAPPPLQTISVQGSLIAEPSLRESLSLAFSGVISGEAINLDSSSFSFSGLFRPELSGLAVFAESDEAYGQGITALSPLPTASSITLTVTVIQSQENPSELIVLITNVAFSP